MKSSAKLLKLFVLAGALMVLRTGAPGLVGQQWTGDQCVTYDKYDEPCPSCCTNDNKDYTNLIEGISNNCGTQSAYIANSPCGQAIPQGCGEDCTGTYYEALDDPACAGGGLDNEPCPPMGNCCAGLICLSDGRCGVCEDEGWLCQDSGDCCGSLQCINGTCQACGLPQQSCCSGNSCSDSYVCDSGTNQCTVGGSPIIVDIDGSGFQLTDYSGGVKFDILNTGQAIQVSWTAPGSTNAFLALDRNGNGTIDNGGELFGNHTPQPATDGENGFLALAVFDQPENGGNGDGVIDSRDAVYSRLQLWIDANHDGLTEPGELHTLPEFGLNSISLDYRLSSRVDRYGNTFRFRAKVDTNSPNSPHAGRWASDVILMMSPSSK